MNSLKAIGTRTRVAVHSIVTSCIILTGITLTLVDVFCKKNEILFGKCHHNPPARKCMIRKLIVCKRKKVRIGCKNVQEMHAFAVVACYGSCLDYFSLKRHAVRSIPLNFHIPKILMFVKIICNISQARNIALF